MLDDNLPTFFLKPAGKAKETQNQHPVYFSYEGSEPSPTYTVQHANHYKNAYGVGLFDAYNPEVLYGEVLVKPRFVHPTLSQEEIRRNNGVAAMPPQPVLPSEFDVQLYDPDQQVRVSLKEGKWGGSDSYEFSVPETSFRVPSASMLDHSQSGPGELEITPRLNFVWRKESKLSRDLTCYMTGRSTDTVVKKKSKRDPDIAVALWRQLRELTIYEPNLQRMELEDPKGFEVALLLAAVTIKDLYMSSKDLRQTFNITDTPPRKLSAGGRKISNPPSHPQQQQQQRHPAAANPASASQANKNPLPRLTPPHQHPTAPAPLSSQAPLQRQADPDPELARLQAEAQAEAASHRQQKLERERAEEAETQRLRKMVEDEAKEAARKQEELERETMRLRVEFGVHAQGQQGQRMNSGRQRPGAGSGFLQPIPQGAVARPGSSGRSGGGSAGRLGSNGLYSQPSASASGLVMSGGNTGRSSGDASRMKKKKSFWGGLRGLSDEASGADGAGGEGSGKRLAKKGSAMW